MYGGRPAQANAIMRVARVCFEQAIVEGVITQNPFRGFKLHRRPPRQVVWPDEAIEAFLHTAVARGDASIGMAIRLGADTGQREGDVLIPPRTSRDGGRIRLRQSKRGAAIDVRLLQSSVDFIEEHGDESGVQIVISERTGRPYKEDHFRHVFAEVRESVAYEIPQFYDPDADRVVQTTDLQFIDLRRTAVVHLGRAGATVPEIAALTGHSERTVHELLRIYLPRDRSVADAAITKREAYRARP